jgi:hypothetical protein
MAGERRGHERTDGEHQRGHRCPPPERHDGGGAGRRQGQAGPRQRQLAGAPVGRQVRHEAQGIGQAPAGALRNRGHQSEEHPGSADERARHRQGTQPAAHGLIGIGGAPGDQCQGGGADGHERPREAEPPADAACQLGAAVVAVVEVDGAGACAHVEDERPRQRVAVLAGDAPGDGVGALGVAAPALQRGPQCGTPVGDLDRRPIDPFAVGPEHPHRVIQCLDGLVESQLHPMWSRLEQRVGARRRADERGVRASRDGAEDQRQRTGQQGNERAEGDGGAATGAPMLSGQARSPDRRSGYGAGRTTPQPLAAGRWPGVEHGKLSTEYLCQELVFA